jgi:4'-phosphopantetheinyl transferase
MAFSNPGTEPAVQQLYWWMQQEADVPEENDWLSPRESSRLASLRIPKRRNDWRLGRWTAKQAVAFCHHLPDHRQSLSEIEIFANESGAPQAFIHKQPAARTISLSHRGGAALCCISDSESPLGCDLELVEPRSNAFIADYFTGAEQKLIAATLGQRQSELLAVLWSAKESALKAMRIGLRLDTRDVSVDWIDTFSGVTSASIAPSSRPQEGVSWRRLSVSAPEGQVFPGWWTRTGSLVSTIVTSEENRRPYCLHSRNVPETE